MLINIIRRENDFGKWFAGESEPLRHFFLVLAR
jgi:hypothetical protein